MLATQEGEGESFVTLRNQEAYFNFQHRSSFFFFHLTFKDNAGASFTVFYTLSLDLIAKPSLSRETMQRLLEPFQNWGWMPDTAAVIPRNARQLFSLTLRLEIVDISVELTLVLHPSISPHTHPRYISCNFLTNFFMLYANRI